MPHLKRRPLRRVNWYPNWIWTRSNHVYQKKKEKNGGRRRRRNKKEIINDGIEKKVNKERLRSDFSSSDDPLAPSSAIFGVFQTILFLPASSFSSVIIIWIYLFIWIFFFWKFTSNLTLNWPFSLFESEIFIQCCYSTFSFVWFDSSSQRFASAADSFLGFFRDSRIKSVTW